MLERMSGGLKLFFDKLIILFSLYTDIKSKLKAICSLFGELWL